MRSTGSRWACLLVGVLSAIAAAGLPAAPASVGLHVEVLDLRVLPAQLASGRSLREVSGLAWDAAENQLVAVGDRGVLTRWRLDIRHGRLRSAVPTDDWSLTGAGKVDAESVEMGTVTLADDRTTFVLDERHDRVIEFDRQGVARRSTALPDAMERAAKGSSNRVEAIAMHLKHGLMVIRQRPDSEHASVHRVHAADGHEWRFRALDGGRASIKAMHLLDADHLLVLEKRVAGGVKSAHLREIDLRRCGSDTTCEAPASPIRHPDLGSDDNLEGLACVNHDLCLVVTDDGHLPAPRTLLLLLRLRR